MGLAYGLHLTEEEAKQLVCAIKNFLLDASVVNALFLWGDYDYGLTLKSLKRYISKAGGILTVPYSAIKNDPMMQERYSSYTGYHRSPNRKAFQRLSSSNKTEYQYPLDSFESADLANSIGGAILYYKKDSSGKITGSIRDKYTFLDKPHKALAVYFTSNARSDGIPLLGIEGLLCCWKGGSRITDIWMGDLETYGLAKSFEVHIDWTLDPSQYN